MAGTIKSIVTTDPGNPRRMIRFSAADAWFEGVDASLLADAILSGIGDATGKGIELVNQTIHAKLIPSGDGVVVQAWDADTETHAPMGVRVTLRVERDPANVNEAARIAKMAAQQKANKAAKDEKDEQKQERFERRLAAERKDTAEAFMHLQVTRASASEETKPKLAEQLRDAAELLSVVRDLAAPAKGLPAGE